MFDLQTQFNHAMQQFQQGHPGEAVRLFNEILQQAPQHHPTLHFYGLALAQQGDEQQALALLKKAVALDNKNPMYLNNLGELFRKTDHIKDARTCFEAVTQMEPTMPEAFYNLAKVLKDLKDYAGATRCYLKAIALKPEYINALYNLANLQREEGREDKALENFRRVLELDPNHESALTNIGNTLKDKDEHTESLECYQKALALNPDNIDLRTNLAQAYRQLGRFDEADEQYRKLIKVYPDKWEYAFHLETQCPIIPENAQVIVDYRAYLKNTLTDFAQRDRVFDMEKLHSSGIEPPFHLSNFDGDILELKQQYASFFRKILPQYEPKKNNGKPHIGIMVTHNHEGVFLKCMTNVVMGLSTKAMRVSIVCSLAGKNIFESRFQKTELEYIVLPDRIDHAAEVIHNACLDFIYYWEVGTDSTNYFLPFFNLAPVQCTGVGWPVTSGIKEIDYFVSSRLLEHENSARLFSETLVPLGDLPLSYKQIQMPEKFHSRDHFSIKQKQNIYLCTQAIHKFNPDFDNLIAGILQRDPNGYFYFIARQPQFKTDLWLQRIKTAYPEISNRIVALEYLSRDEFFSLLSVVDVMLDTPHYSGANTSYDALSVNCPVVTLPSLYHIGRFTLSLYKKMDMEECVAASAQDYIDIALKLGIEKDYRQQISEKIKQRKELLFDDHSVVKEHEAFFLNAIH